MAAAVALIALSAMPVGLHAQAAPAAPAATAAKASGTVKSLGADSVTLTTTDGQDVTVSLPATAKILIVPPGSHDLKSAAPGTASDIAPGDRALATASPGDTSTPLKAARLIVMKGSAIAQNHADEEAAWQHGGGGIVKSIDSAGGTVNVVNGARTLQVKTTPATTVRRYASGSVRFEDAVSSNFAAIRPGDQLRVRGEKSADGAEITADAIVAGSFQHYSGLISAVDASAQTITLKDLASKRVVTVRVTSESNVRRLPPNVAQMIAGSGKAHEGEGQPARGSAAGPQASGAGPEGARRRPELAQILPRLPAGTLSDLKAGDAVMIVATSPGETSVGATAITLVAGVEPILAAPGGESQTLSPWSVGGGEPEAAGVQ